MAIEAIDAIEAIVAIDYIEAVGFWGCGLGGVEEKQSRLRRKKTAPTAFLNHEFIKEVSHA